MIQDEPRHLSDEDLLLWQTRELPAGDFAVARVHLELCGSCRSRLRETKAILAELTEHTRQKDLRRFSGMLSAASPSRRAPSGLRRPIWAALPAAAIVTGFLLWNSSVPLGW